jgi:hypothetical protein
LFKAQLKANPHLKHLEGRLFFIYNDNHRFEAWIGFIEMLHRVDKKWHISVESICLDMKKKIRLLLNAIHDVNK